MAYGVEFENEQESSVLYARIQRTSETPRIIQKLKEWGIAQTDKQATYILFGFSAVAICLSLVFFIVGGTVPGPINGAIPAGQVVPV